jgi:mRNA-degrading endonuclease YafQ of YafQ-DinJ toxin-antitoxin module
MRVVFRKTFQKQFKKLPKKVRERFGVRLQALLTGETTLLRIHTLTGDRYPLQSMNVTADYRALFIKDTQTVVFYEIGTHSELYE